MLGPPKIKRTRRMFQIEAMDERGWPQEVLAVISDGNVAQAAYDEAVRQHPDRKVRLRRGTSAMAESPPLADGAPSRTAATASH
jgi:hypothetical protein